MTMKRISKNVAVRNQADNGANGAPRQIAFLDDICSYDVNFWFVFDNVSTLSSEKAVFCISGLRFASIEKRAKVATASYNISI